MENKWLKMENVVEVEVNIIDPPVPFTHKRFFLFGGTDAARYGGWNDFKGHFTIEEEAVDFAQRMGYKWYHVVDSRVLYISYFGYNNGTIN